MLTEDISCAQRRLLLVEFDLEYAFFEFPAVYDADVLNADAVDCECRGDRGDRSGLVDDIAEHPVRFLDAAK